ncbi:MAG: hypothetical protein RLZZ507_4182 [Cyanobacteriota bacterium]|jgi:hypothetical protein
MNRRYILFTYDELSQPETAICEKAVFGTQSDHYLLWTFYKLVKVLL